MTTRTAILTALRAGPATIAALAERAGVSHRQAITVVGALEALGLVEVQRGGGRGRETTVTISEVGAKSCACAEIPGRVYEDPADLTPGAEHTRVPADRLEAVRAERRAQLAAKRAQYEAWMATQGGGR